MGCLPTLMNKAPPEWSMSAKAVTLRRARASGAVLMKPSTLDMICHGTAAKGDVIATARIAGIMAAKRTGELIPLCHPLGIEAVTVTLEPQGADRLSIAATVTTVARTGVEMEALTAVTVTALTVYDMCKAVDRAMTITDIRLDEKAVADRVITGGTTRTSNPAMVAPPRMDVE